MIIGVLDGFSCENAEQKEGKGTFLILRSRK